MDENESNNFIKSNEYVFYPIQYLREGRVTMRAPEFYNQLWLIEYISRSLPYGYELVVKDHPQQLGSLPMSHMYAIDQYAKVVSPKIPARKVISHSDAVITLNNTVGYEAIMWGKPVLTLGDAFYSGYKYTQDVSNLNSLPSYLSDAVESGGLNKYQIIEFSHGVIKSSYPGAWGDPDPENIDTFINSIQNYMNSLGINEGIQNF